MNVQLIKSSFDISLNETVRKTEQTYKWRIYQHMGFSPRTSATLTIPVQSDIIDHCLKHKNKINIDNFEIIDGCLENSELLILESLHQNTKNSPIKTLTQSTTF